VASDERPPADTSPSEAIPQRDAEDPSLDGWRGDDQALWRPATGQEAQGFGKSGRRLMPHSTFHQKQARRAPWQRRPASLGQSGPRTPWRRPPVHAPSRGLRVFKLSLVAAGILAAATVAVLVDAYYESYRIYQDAKGVLPPLASAADELAQGRVPAEEPIDEALEAAGRARRRMDDARFTFRLAGAVPYFGRPVRAIQHTVAAGEHEARAAGLMRDLASEVLGGEGEQKPRPQVFRNGRVDLELLDAAVPRLESVVSEVRTADREIRAIPSLPFMGHLDRLKSDALEASGQAVTMAEEALLGARVLPSLLGSGGSRTFLLVLQDGSRLRATGGTAVAWGLVEAADGRLAPVETGSLGTPTGMDSAGPVALPPSIRRYLEIVTALRWAADPVDLNLSPDFPASAEAWTSFAESVSGRSTDGAIALDTVALSYLLEGREVFVPSRGGPVSGQNVVRVIGESHELGSPGREVLAAEVLAAAWSIISDPDPLLPTLKQIGRALREKHLQIWSAMPPDQPHLDALGWDGSLDMGSGDHLQVAATNLLANGLDQYAHLEIEYEVTVLASGDIRSTCVITLRNEAPGRLPAAIAGEGRNAGSNRSLVALYVPGTARLDGADPADGPPAHAEAGGMVFLRTVRAPTGEEDSVRFEYTVPGAVSSTDEGRLYRLTLQSQPSVNPAEVTVRVTLPAGATVRTAPGWTLEGRVATLRLTLTRDLVRQIEF
jgi:hypothetical protein